MSDLRFHIKSLAQRTCDLLIHHRNKTHPLYSTPVTAGDEKTVTQSLAGFTLLELLVVVAILALLLGLLFPVIGMVKGRSQARVCASNLSQIGKALLIYSQDNDGGIPHESNDLRRFRGLHTSKEGEPHKPDYLWTVLGKYLQQRDVLFCPADPFARQNDQSWCVDHRYTSYKMPIHPYNHPDWTQDHLPIPRIDDPNVKPQRTELNPSQIGFAVDAEAQCFDVTPGPNGSPRFMSAHAGSFNYVAYDGSLHQVTTADIAKRRQDGIKRLRDSH